MNYRINNLPVGMDEKDFVAAISEKTGIPYGEISDVILLKRSLDCRHGKVRPILSLGFGCNRDLSGTKDVFPYEKPVNLLDGIRPRNCKGLKAVVAGSGPAGLFCSLALAKVGADVTLLERGDNVAERKKAVTSFWNGGKLDVESNVQFGLGGAGTFSDGKLTTGVNDKRLFTVFDTFGRFGADKDIMYSSTPHIGTDVLETVVARFRDELLRLGVTIKFRTKLTDVEIEDGNLSSVIVNDGADERIDCDALVLAVGHSARDTFEMLLKRGVAMERKSFAVGVRIEHPQSIINEYKYGKFTHPDLEAADYKLVEHLSDGRTAYTFCMCPGGFVTAAASESECLVTNGMSNRDRGGFNSNSALLVNVNPEDFGGDGVLAGVEFQRRLEKAAFSVFGNYVAPAENALDFISGRKEFGNDYVFKVQPTYRRGVKPCNLRKCLPDFVSRSLAEAIPIFGKRIKGFDSRGVLTAVETRSSSPVRIIRNAEGVSNVKGIYPCGEGAGYAGGIVSAAVDGLIQAERILSLCLDA